MTPARTVTTAKSEKLPQTLESVPRPSAQRERERERREDDLLLIGLRQILWRDAGPRVGRIGRPSASLDAVGAVLGMGPD